MPVDLEKLIDNQFGVFWTSQPMQNQVWFGLNAMRATLHACGYRTTSEEYETLTFLLAIHHDLVTTELEKAA